MTTTIVVCEGQTEEAFVNRVLASHLATHGVYVEARLVPTSKHGKGGALSGQRVLSFLGKTLLQRSDTYVTTFFDLYGLPSDFPGLSSTARRLNPLDWATQIEAGFHKTVVENVECRPDRFLPHIQPYEFEALLFSDLSMFAKAESAWQPFVAQLKQARGSSGSPEHINDGPATHPSALLGILRPPYGKVRHGIAVSKEIGIQRIRAECRHFDEWLARLEALPPLGDKR